MDILPKAILIDMDKTLTLLNGRDPYDETGCEHDLPNRPILDIALTYQIRGYSLLIVTGRHEWARPATLAWLHEYHIHPTLLLMRAQGDSRSQLILKEELYHEHIYGRYDIFFVLEDRGHVARMYRHLGLTVLQVAENE